MGVEKSAKARACANIALAKYWGKAPGGHNIPAVPSVSMTLEGLYTETAVFFSPDLTSDECVLNGQSVSDDKLTRIQRMLDRVRRRAGCAWFARVQTQNNFPTTAGLASSASGFAALAAACFSALGLENDPVSLSQEARRSSVSASRSIWGGYVRLDGGIHCDDSLAAQPLFDAEYWPLACIVAVVDTRPKAISSTDGMRRTTETSPYFDGWVRSARQTVDEVERALRQRDIERLGQAMEQSTFRMHACAMAAERPLLYWQPATLRVIESVWALRGRQDVQAYVTMDAGPQVKIICEPSEAHHVEAMLASLGDSISMVITTKPGEGTRALYES